MLGLFLCGIMTPRYGVPLVCFGMVSWLITSFIAGYCINILLWFACFFLLSYIITCLVVWYMYREPRPRK